MCLLFSDRLTWTFSAETEWRLALRHKSLTSDMVRLSPAPVVTSSTLINARLRKRWKVREGEENKKWIVRRTGDDTLRRHNPPPSFYTKGKWGVQTRLNAKLSAGAASTEGHPNLFCTATCWKEKKLDEGWWDRKGDGWTNERQGTWRLIFISVVRRRRQT